MVGAWLVVTSTCFGGQLRWTGVASFYYAEGTNYDTAPTLGAPLFTLTPPSSATRTYAMYPGLTFRLEMSRIASQNVRLRAGVLPSADARVIAPAGAVAGEVQSRKRVVIEAEYQITQLGSPTSMLADLSSGGGATGAATQTANQIDEAQSQAKITLSETTTVQGVTPLSDVLSRSYLNVEGVVQPVPDPEDFSAQTLLDRHNGIYKLRVEVDLRARAFGNSAEERASATWNQLFDLNLSLFDFSGTIPEPSTGALALVGVAAAGLGLLRRRRVDQPQG
ncbi:MAG: PEP-CTERM sorting domain-containing protein [Planctomycetaceae bacterium]